MQFIELNVNPLIIDGIKKMEFEELTDIQEKVIPIAIQGQDIIGQAPTGTGKTLAFAIPILNNIDETSSKVQAIIIAPTRELAVQITKEINEVAYYMKKVSALAIYGGESIEKQITALKKRPQIIVATPGRLMDHMRRATVRLDHVNIVALDEADEMLNMGFREDIECILEDVKSEHQTMLFSATFSEEIEEIAKRFMNDSIKVRVNQKSLTVSLVEQFYINAYEKDKVEIISRFIDINEYKLSMVFCNTKKAVDEVTSELLTRGFMAEALHGDMKQMQRDRVMDRFRKGTINILVASDVAARGLDIDDVEAVFNYDLPTDEEYYVHRIGRTGRAKRTGVSISLVTKSDRHLLKTILKYSKADIKKIEAPALDKVIKVRAKRIIDRAFEASAEISKYDAVIQKELDKIDDFEKDILIKGLTNLLINAGEKNSEIDIVKEEIEDRKKRYSSNDVRFFVNVGRIDKVKVYNITDLICKKTRLDNSQINAVELHEHYSFFEIPNKYVEEVLGMNGNAKLFGKNLSFEVAKPKKNSNSSKKDGKKDTKKSFSKNDYKKSSDGYYVVNAKQNNIPNRNRNGRRK